ncbi:TetR/AcrR family transcriptional regulator [Occultella glacieicola]|uniref:TetR/AcrR family transcriptional regulator n=1 Tax=Occultella glacieicola TaxID=2518684 RepID=A0ABY2EA81_9MICO|nr:TetR/AcrR family transcriptional regulator [Occultella glacieicola]TDE98979.1 TetR/AcrR family transcriptional regulator [Occultella glacieicola]
MPKIIGSTLAEHRAHVRTKLFTALSQLMAEAGFDSVSLADIAARAGVGRTSVYNHFPDKESLLISFIEHETSHFVAELTAALAQVDDPHEQLRVYVREQISLKRVYHLAPGPDLRSVVSHETGMRLREHVIQVEVLLRRILEAGIADGSLPDQDVSAVVPLINSCLSGRTFPDSGPDRERAITATESFVLRAVGLSEDALQPA